VRVTGNFLRFRSVPGEGTTVEVSGAFYKGVFSSEKNPASLILIETSVPDIRMDEKGGVEVVLRQAKIVCDVEPKEDKLLVTCRRRSIW